MICPLCERSFNKKDVIVHPSGDRAPCCKAPLKQDRDGSKITYLLDESKIDDSGFIVLDDGPPQIKRRVKGEGLVDYVVTYENTFTDGNYRCPECNGYLGQARVIKGEITLPPCRKSLREEYDGKDGRCKKRTTFIFNNVAVGGLPTVFR